MMSCKRGGEALREDMLLCSKVADGDIWMDIDMGIIRALPSGLIIDNEHVSGVYRRRI
jgi:hypothetical protein